MPVYRIVGPLRDWPLADGENVIGSDQSADIRLESPRVEPRHAIVEVRTDGVRILQEEGKVELNGKEAGPAAKVSPGDVCAVGGVQLRLAWTGFEEEHPKVTRRRSWLKVLGWGLAAGVVLVLLALLSMPLFINASLVEELIQRSVERTLKRSAKLEGLDVGAYSGRVRVERLVIENRAEFSDVPFLSAEDVELHVDIWRLVFSLGTELSFRLGMKKPVLLVERDEKGAWNVSDIVERARAELARFEWPVSAAYDEVDARIELKEGKLKIARAGPPVEYEFDLAVTQGALSKPLEIELKARSPGNGTARLRSKVELFEGRSMTPESVKGEVGVELDGFDLAGAGLLSGELKLALHGPDSLGSEFRAEFLGSGGEAGQIRGSFKKEHGPRAAGSLKVAGSWSAGEKIVLRGEIEGMLGGRAELSLNVQAGEAVSRKLGLGPVELDARVSGPREECSWELIARCERPGFSGKLLGKARLGEGIVPEEVSLDGWSSEGGAIELLDASAVVRGLGSGSLSCELRELSLGVDPAAMGVGWKGGRVQLRAEGRGEAGEFNVAFAAEERAVVRGLRAKGELKLGEESSGEIEFAGWADGKLEAWSSPEKRGLRMKGTFDVGELFRRLGLPRASGTAQIKDLGVKSMGPKTNVVWEASLRSFRLDGGPDAQPFSEERLDAIGNVSFEGGSIAFEKFKVSSSTLWCELSGEVASLEELLGAVSVRLQGDLARLMRAARWAGWLEREVDLEGSVSLALKADGTKGTLEIERAVLDCSAGKLVAQGALSGLREETPGGALEARGNLGGEKLAGLLGGTGSGEGELHLSLRGTENRVELNASADLSRIGFSLPGLFEKPPGVEARVSIEGTLRLRDGPSLEVRAGGVSLGGLELSFAGRAGLRGPGRGGTLKRPGPSGEGKSRYGDGAGAELRVRAENLKLPLLASFVPPLAELDPKGVVSFDLSGGLPWSAPRGTVRADCRLRWPPKMRSSIGLKGELTLRGREFSSKELELKAPGLLGAVLRDLEGKLDRRRRVRVKANLVCDELDLRGLMEGLGGSSLRTSPFYAEGRLLASKVSWGELSCGRTKGSFSFLGRTLRLELGPSPGLGGTIKGWVRLPLAARAERSAEASFERLDVSRLWERVQGRASGRVYWSGEEMPWEEGSASIEAISRGLTLVAKDSALEKMAAALGVPARLGGIDLILFTEQGTLILPPTDLAASDGTRIKLSLQVGRGGKLSGTVSTGKKLIISGTVSRPEWEEQQAAGSTRPGGGL